MSMLRIVNVGPIVRGHYGTLWSDSQHPIGYLFVLLGIPLTVSLLGLAITVDSAIANSLVTLFGVILALSARSAFNIPKWGDDDGVRKQAALRQLRRGAMYAVLVGIVSFTVSAAVAASYHISSANPELVSTVTSVLSAGAVSTIATIASVALIFLFVHYIVTLVVMVRWLYLMSEAGAL